MYRLLTGGRYRRHVEQLRRRLDEGREPTLARFESLGFEVVHRPAGGFFCWLKLPEGLSASRLSRRAAEEGMLLAPGRYFSHQPDADSFMRINPTHCSEALWPRLERLLQQVSD